MEVPETLLPDGWESVQRGSAVRCPHGHVIELDGKCPEGCTSPLRELGYI